MESGQAIASGHDRATGTLTRASCKPSRGPIDGWRAAALPIAVTIGSSGLAWGEGLHPRQSGRLKKEGDGRSPAGVFRVGEAFGYAASLPIAMQYQGMNESDYCVDVTHIEVLQPNCRCASRWQCGGRRFHRADATRHPREWRYTLQNRICDRAQRKRQARGRQLHICAHMEGARRVDRGLHGHGRGGVTSTARMAAARSTPRHGAVAAPRGSHG